MKNVKIALTSLLVGALLLTTSCSDDDSPEQGHHHDEVTLVQVIVTDGDGNTETYDIHAEHEDHDDKNGNKEEDDEVEIELYANSTYSVEIKFLNDEDPNDIEDATLEILEEKDEHFIVFSKEAGVNLSITRTDDASSTRADGNKIGLSTDWTTGAASPEGHVEVKLYHEPTEVSEASNGNDFGSVGAGSETDVDVHFAVVVIEQPV
ncbi:hypothetical protein [Seonamhaeicola marinus]|uniref:Type 1 periplasmic binding fold superfamily protein n=1 Tax=Seonamhaeicola marinus TaxID=1912246 RepID=A0A5D0HJM7_9FLAO|nr:hypothetical protein [Seonamhaeicola marinus]TYA71521.1 hypothetical protein FUA24_18255 [Seonamhaeicola marinus]